LDERRGLIENEELTLEKVRATLSSVTLSIKKLVSVDLNSPTSGKVVEIVAELDSIIGGDDVAGAGTNADRAEALALKATVYRLVTFTKREAGAGVVKPEPVSSLETEGLALKKEGEECFGVKDCEDGLACEFDEVTAMDVCVKKVVEVKKVSWQDLVDGGYGSNLPSGGQAIVLNFAMSPVSIKGAYDEETQAFVVVMDGLEETYFASRNSDGNIVFEKI
jgi:hypothetical protein